MTRMTCSKENFEQFSPRKKDLFNQSWLEEDTVCQCCEGSNCPSVKLVEETFVNNAYFIIFRSVSQRSVLEVAN
eukprot:m.348090 g.348090  ORF g.348090 m.348090 type:complete len:74 (+) comp35436_c0_seq1:109-330(+)